MRKGWIYLNNKKVYVHPRLFVNPHEVRKVMYTYNEDEGWKELNRSDLVQSIIDGLAGTCKSLMVVCDDHNIEEDELTLNELDEIEDSIFLCDCCAWWYERGDDRESDDGSVYCSSCYDYMDNDSEE